MRMNRILGKLSMFRHLRIAILAFALAPLSHSFADGLPAQSRSFAAPRLTLVQMFDPERCKARCQREYQFCARVVNESAIDNQIKQLGLDGCEDTFEKCVRACY
jgi:hypothetical protein